MKDPQSKGSNLSSRGRQSAPCAYFSQTGNKSKRVYGAPQVCPKAKTETPSAHGASLPSHPAASVAWSPLLFPSWVEGLPSLTLSVSSFYSNRCWPVCTPSLFQCFREYLHFQSHCTAICSHGSSFYSIHKAFSLSLSHLLPKFGFQLVPLQFHLESSHLRSPGQRKVNKWERKQQKVTF